MNVDKTNFQFTYNNPFESPSSLQNKERKIREEMFKRTYESLLSTGLSDEKAKAMIFQNENKGRPVETAVITVDDTIEGMEDLMRECEYIRYLLNYAIKQEEIGRQRSKDPSYPRSCFG